jgi:hypothetical protein
LSEKPVRQARAGTQIGGQFSDKANSKAETDPADPGLPEELLAMLPPATGDAWRKIAPLLPPSAYLAGGTALTVHLLHRISRDLDIFLERHEDLQSLWKRIAGAGDALASQQDDHTINCVFDSTRVQVLDASTQAMVAPTTTIGGLRIASIEDIMAMKLKVIVDRGELRDYFDLMSIETKCSLFAETGLALSIERYSPSQPDQYVNSIVKSLGYFQDVADDPELPAPRSEIEEYWMRRQRPLMKHIAMFGG